MTDLKKILKFALPYKRFAFLNIFFNSLYAVFSALAYVALIPMLQVLFNPESIKVTQEPEWTGITDISSYGKAYLNYHVTEIAGNDKMEALILVICLVLIMFLLKNIFSYLAMFFITFLRNGVLRDLRDKLYSKITELPMSFYSEKRKGDTIARMTSDVQEIQHSFLSVLELIFREPLTIISTLVVMLALSVKLTIFVLIFIPVSGFLISLIGKSLKRKSEKVQQEQGTILSILEETLGGLKVIKGFNAEGIFTSKFQESTGKHFKYLNTLVNRNNLSRPVSEVLGIGIIAVLLFYGGRLVLVEGTFAGPDFIAFMALAYNILTPAKAISKASYNVKQGNAAAERVLEILETESPLKDKPDAQTKTDFNQEIAINNISFKYEDEYVLKNFSIKVPKGQSVALVGQSGSGKSTIANLVTRFYDVNEGNISIDGIDIRDLEKTSLRGLMGLVTQDSILFNDTVKNNLLIGNQSATDEAVIEALKVANAWEFVKDLPQGIDTNIGDSGNKLSGGQKQRLSIARAVLKNPPIMILDEATSALDTESERLVQSALENMMMNRTSLVIAHRLSTIQKADMIVVMQRGEIVEQGKHEELLAKGGNYKMLVDMQSLE